MVAGLPLALKGAERHLAKMANRKAVQDAEVAQKTIEKGLLIVHTGTGKGKSTAAFGLALRMLGRGHRVGVVQFIKARGIRPSAMRSPVSAIRSPGMRAISRRPSAPGPRRASSWPIRAFPSSFSTSSTNDYLDLGAVIAAVCERRAGLHVVVTGRNAKPELLPAADLVTEMTLVKHHFAAGVKAQPGIEF
jgi:cob(I)alamin adenosyltransferase